MFKLLIKEVNEKNQMCDKSLFFLDLFQNERVYDLTYCNKKY